jgi:hypothetical protein
MTFTEFIIEELNDQEDNNDIEYDDYSIVMDIDYTSQE